MVELGYYSKRLDELENRKNEVMGRLATNKLSLKSINSEIKKCEEKMNDLTSVIDVNKSDSEKKILDLSNQLDKSIELNNSLKKEITQLNHDLQSKDVEINRLKRKLIMVESKDDVVLSDKFHDKNIFDDIMEEYK